MKTFNNFNSAFNWIDSKIKKATDKSIEEVAREEYKDSEKYIYYDTGEMYNSGLSSDFKGGYVIVKAPQVRWLYYTPWIVPRHNMMAVPQWHEATKRENMKKYKNIYINNFNKGE